MATEKSVSWGQISGNVWGPIAQSKFGVGIRRRVFQLIYFDPQHTIALDGQIYWRQNNGNYEMDLLIPKFDEKRIHTFDSIQKELQLRPISISMLDNRLESLIYLLESLSLTLQRYEEHGVRIGLITPQNVVSVVHSPMNFLRSSQISRKRHSESSQDQMSALDLDLLSRAKKSRSFVLPDAGFQLDGSRSSNPSWIVGLDRFRPIWERSAIEELCGDLKGVMSVRLISRLTAWTLHPDSISTGRVVPDVRQNVPKLWEILEAGADGCFPTIAEFRRELSGVDLFEFSDSKSTAGNVSSQPKLRNAQWSLLAQGAFMLMIAIVLAAGFWLWWNWPRPIVSGIPAEGYVGNWILLDTSGSNGQLLELQWANGDAWQLIPSNQKSIAGMLTEEGIQQVTLRATTTLFPFRSIERSVKQEIMVKQNPASIHSPLDGQPVQYLNVTNDPLARQILVEVRLPQDRIVSGRLQVDNEEFDLRPNEPLKLPIDSSPLRIVWIPNVNPFGIHSEFVDIGSSNSVEGGNTLFTLTPNPGKIGMPVILNSLSIDEHLTGNFSKPEIDWGDGTPKEKLVTSGIAHHRYAQAGTYKVDLTWEDQFGKVRRSTEKLLVEANQLMPTDTDFLEINREISDRVQSAGGKSAERQITLTWENENDLDLWVVTDAKEVIYYGHTESKCGGKLDVDVNVNPTTEKPVENVVWSGEAKPKGPVRIYVVHYKNHGKNRCNDPTPFNLRIRIPGIDDQILKGEISYTPDRKPMLMAVVEL